MRRKRLTALVMMIVLCLSMALGLQAEVMAAGGAPERITLSKKSVAITEGESVTLKVKSVKPKSASKKVTWKSSDNTVVTVSSKGVLKAQKAGSAVITAKAANGKASARCKVTVKARKEEKKPKKFYLIINDRVLTAKFEDNSSAKALAEKLQEGDIVIQAHDYGNFEKVGDLGFSLPTNDKRITTKPGDVILYQGNQLTVYYDENTWSFTLLGHIQKISQEELKEILGEGDVTITLSLTKPESSAKQIRHQRPDPKDDSKKEKKQKDKTNPRRRKSGGGDFLSY